jgi:hypothetical protein
VPGLSDALPRILPNNLAHAIELTSARVPEDHRHAVAAAREPGQAGLVVEARAFSSSAASRSGPTGVPACVGAGVSVRLLSRVVVCRL